MSDEFSRIAALATRIGSPGRGVTLGIGDDAAILAPLAGGIVLSVDTAIEGVHFRRGWAPLRTLARRAVMAALSDLAAMGAAPRATLVALALPADLDDAAFLELVDGTADAAREAGAPLVGGNLASAGELSITTTVVGEAGMRSLTRAGAQVGDAIYVTGVLGAAALGLALLSRGEGDAVAGAAFVAHWCTPTARLAEGRALVSGGATACIDVSDGLAQDLGHLCATSAIATRIELAALPMLAEQRAQARALRLDAETLAVAGGEDYELVFTGPASATLAAIGTRIGEVVHRDADEGSRSDAGGRPVATNVQFVDAHGRTVALAARGFVHFRR